MFDIFKKPVKHPAIRDLLFGDLPLDYWSSINKKESPWNLFALAKQSLNKGDTNAAVTTLQEIIALPALESRHYLQAWHFLRHLGIPPVEEIKMYGVVVEVGMTGGLDLLAVYADHLSSGLWRWQ